MFIFEAQFEMFQMKRITEYSNGSSEDCFQDDFQDSFQDSSEDSFQRDSIVVIKTSNGASWTIEYEIAHTFEEFLALNLEFTDSNDFEQQFVKITSYETVKGKLCVKSFETFGTNYCFKEPLPLFNKHHAKAPLYHIFKFNFDDSLVSANYGRPYVILNPIRLFDKAIVKKYYDISQKTSGISKKLANRCKQYKVLRIIQKKRSLTTSQETSLNNLKRNILRENPKILERVEFMIWVS